MYEVIATHTFKLCLDRLTHFLELKYTPTKARKTKDFIKKTIRENLGQNPFIAPVSSRLIELGIKDYRQYLIDEHNVVFSRANEKDEQVILLAIMDGRQSIQKLLYEVMLLS